ncbi:CHRD domain-containing protein [Paludisphaera soli]|uniref:CHRD domain-containing protein n=1 Tax=Paludisphaera soli TaxID=2712865 RepID=UPI0013ED462A|nr:CHRD domain-containing protein [Paludisphaera soli]
MKSAIAMLVALGLLSSAARADFVATATLTGAEEVPPNASPAVGFVTIVYEAASESLAYSISYGGLSGDLAGAHIHLGPMGVAGPILFPFSGVPAGPSGLLAGVLTAAEFVSQPGAATFADAVVAIESGGAYVNLHTADFPAGEIRGQLSVFATPVPEPAGLALMGIGAAAFGTLALRRRPAGT